MKPTTSVLLLAAVASLSAQQQQQPPPTFKSGVQLIEVDVRVFDKEGRFVGDLAKGDFEVLENGVPQRIDSIYYVPGSAAPSAVADSGTSAAPQTWIFVFDLSHLTPGSGFDRARKAVEEFLTKRFREGDIGGVMAGEKMVNNRLTSVREELIGAMKQIKPRSDARTRHLQMTREWPRLLNEEETIRIARGERDPTRAAITRACGDDRSQCQMADGSVNEKARRMAAEFHRASMNSMSSLHALAVGLARVPGPKTVVLLSDGFTVQDIETTLRTVVGQVARSGARIYAIDVRGLDRGNTVEQMASTDETASTTRFDQLADAPNSLAVDTGGIMIRNENNIGRALDRITEDSATYYVLAYQPANTTFDGKYRPIQVKVGREGVRVRARRGYLAIEPSKMITPQPIK